MSELEGVKGMELMPCARRDAAALADVVRSSRPLMEHLAKAKTAKLSAFPLPLHPERPLSTQLHSPNPPRLLHHDPWEQCSSD